MARSGSSLWRSARCRSARGRWSGPLSLPVAATGGRGALSDFDLARKDCLGTARNTTSKIWYTVADGVLSDVYAPTIDTTNVETMQYLVTDGSTFTDLQTRDTTYTVVRRSDRDDLHGHLARPRAAHYRLITTYLTDPARDSVVVHTQLHAADRGRAQLPALRPAGRDGRRQRWRRHRQRRRRHARSPTPRPARRCRSPTTPTPTTNAANRDYAVPELPRAAGRPAVRAGEQRLRRHGRATG